MMKIFTKEEARGVLNGKSPDGEVAKRLSELQLMEGAYSTPLQSGVQIVLSKIFADLMLRDVPVCLYITLWGISVEHLDLFYGYRRSVGETRRLIEASFHVFEKTDEEAFISVLCMVLFFFWDASVFDIDGKFLLQTSHDGWLEIRTNDQALISDLAVEMAAMKIRPLSPRS